MAKKILVITGSPKKEGNTNTLAKAFIAGALAGGHEVEVFDAYQANMDGCHGDGSCHKRGRCGLKDDGQKMFDLMCWADTLVLVSPVYWGGFTSYMKKAIDRFYPFFGEEVRKKCTVKETVLIAAAMAPDENAFEIIRKEFDHVNAVLGFEKKAELLAPGLGGPDDAGKDEALLVKAALLGTNI
jgi:multimeric flavodoxin WrbA